jgi:hypothetical protein
MQKKLSLLAAAFIVVLVTVAGALAQDEATSRYKNGKMIEMSDMLSSTELDKCTSTSKRYGGTVLTVVFTSGKIIDYFTLRTSKGSVKIHISPELYDSRISKQDALSLPSLVAKGRKVTVDAYRCGELSYAVYILSGIELDTLGML